MLCKVTLPHGVQEVSNDTFICDVLCRDLGIDDSTQAMKLPLCFIGIGMATVRVAEKKGERETEEMK